MVTVNISRIESWKDVHLTFSPRIFSVQVKSWSILHHGSLGASSEENKRNLTLTLTFNLLLLLPSIVFMIKFVSLS